MSEWSRSSAISFVWFTWIRNGHDCRSLTECMKTRKNSIFAHTKNFPWRQSITTTQLVAQFNHWSTWNSYHKFRLKKKWASYLRYYDLLKRKCYRIIIVRNMLAMHDAYNGKPIKCVRRKLATKNETIKFESFFERNRNKAKWETESIGTLNLPWAKQFNNAISWAAIASKIT